MCKSGRTWSKTERITGSLIELPALDHYDRRSFLHEPIIDLAEEDETLSDLNQTEEEQIEEIKQWWKDNGMSIVLGICIGLGGLFGYRGWQAHEKAQAEAASMAFQNMIASARENQREDTHNSASQLLNEFSGTSYAVFAALAEAKLAVEEEEYSQAAKHLNFAIDNAPDTEFKRIATIRLARVLFAEGNYDEALTQLDSKHYGQSTPLSEELKGDILKKKGDTEGAYEAYSSAIAGLKQEAPAFAILELKLDSVGRSN